MKLTSWGRRPFSVSPGQVLGARPFSLPPPGAPDFTYVEIFPNL